MRSHRLFYLLLGATGLPQAALAQHWAGPPSAAPPARSAPAVPGPSPTHDPAASERRLQDSVSNWRSEDRDRLRSARTGGGPLVQPRGPLPPVLDQRGVRPPVAGGAARRSEPPLARLGRRDGGGWDPQWRSDRRYDWRDWRRRHRGTFRLGVYVDPYGWAYRPVHVGRRLWPDHYRSGYWIGDPWHYRLPRVGGRYRWIRYWNDALLVDMVTGQVVDVVPSVFW